MKGGVVKKKKGARAGGAAAAPVVAAAAAAAGAHDDPRFAITASDPRFARFPKARAPTHSVVNCCHG